MCEVFAIWALKMQKVHVMSLRSALEKNDIEIILWK